jgi:sugar lactone lactonase YvrE
MNDVRSTDRNPIERRVAAWMADEAPASSTPSDREIDRILTATSRLRPDPRWLALLKESPMRTTTGTGPRIAVGTPARAFVLLLLLVGLLAAIGIAVVASGVLRPAVIPPPPLSALTWRQSVPNGDFLPLARLARDPQGRIWVADAGNARFAIYQSDGTFVEYWQPSDGPAFNLQRANLDVYGTIVFEPDGSSFILDVGNHRVLAYDPSGAFVTTWGSEGTAQGQFSDPVDILVRDDGSVAVLDDNRGVVETYDRDGTVLGSINVSTTTPAGFNTANGLAIDSSGNLYVSQVATARSGQVQKFSPTGQPLTIFGATGPGKFKEQPNAIAFDRAGHVYVTEGPLIGDGLGVLIFNPDGTFVGGFGRSGSEADLGFPTGILLDGAGNLVVVDSGRLYRGQLENPSIRSYRISLPASQ